MSALTYRQFMLAVAGGVQAGLVEKEIQQLPIRLSGGGPLLSVKVSDAGIDLCGLHVVDGGRVAVLEGENRQLRAEVSRLRQLTGSHGPRVDAAVGNEEAARRRAQDRHSVGVFGEVEP